MCDIAARDALRAFLAILTRDSNQISQEDYEQMKAFIEKYLGTHKMGTFVDIVDATDGGYYIDATYSRACFYMGIPENE